MEEERVRESRGITFVGVAEEPFFHDSSSKDEKLYKEKKTCTKGDMTRHGVQFVSRPAYRCCLSLSLSLFSTSGPSSLELAGIHPHEHTKNKKKKIVRETRGEKTMASDTLYTQHEEDRERKKKEKEEAPDRSSWTSIFADHPQRGGRDFFLFVFSWIFCPAPIFLLHSTINPSAPHIVLCVKEPIFFSL